MFLLINGLSIYHCYHFCLRLFFKNIFYFAKIFFNLWSRKIKILYPKAYHGDINSMQLVHAVCTRRNIRQRKLLACIKKTDKKKYIHV